MINLSAVAQPPRWDRLSVDQATHNKIVSFIWGIADDVLRDLFRRGKRLDVILPMCVIRRILAIEKEVDGLLDGLLKAKV
jgi:hypothetical protein